MNPFNNDEEEKDDRIKATPQITTSNNDVFEYKVQAPKPSLQSSKQVTEPAPVKNPVVEARQMAAKLKREGKTAEAMEWLKKSKIIERSIDIKGSSSPKLPVSAASTSQKQNMYIKPENVASVTVSKNAPVSSGKYNLSPDRFAPLEKALIEASNLSLEEAKSLKEAGNNPEAIKKMKEYKKYSQELDVLRARRDIPNAIPPLFRWDTIRSQHKIEHLDIADDQLKIVIHKVTGLKSSLQTYSSRTVILSYDLGIPKDSPATGKITGTANAEGTVEFKFTTVLSSVIKRSTRMANLSSNAISRRKAHFDLILKRGFLLSDIPLGSVSLPLADLSTHCECGGELPLTIEEGNHRKAMPGSLEVHLMIRTPLSTAEIAVSEERVLVVDPWPEVNESSDATDKSTTLARSTSTRTDAPTSSASSVRVDSHMYSNKTAPAASTASVMSSNKIASASQVGALGSRPPDKQTPGDRFSDLSPEEKNDPLSVNLLLSNDVLEDEIASIERRLKSTVDKDMQFNLSMRQQLASNKLSFLVRGVQDETIVMADYLSMIRERVARDLRILAYLQTVPKRNAEVEERVRNRIALMQSEIAGAENA
jgi:hypothetical protein